MSAFPLSVVVPSYRRPARLRIMLTTLMAAIRDEVPGTQVIVADDGGGGVEDTVQSLGARVEVIGGAHAGRSVARNRGARAARGVRLLFLDDDVVLTPGVLAAHIRRATVNPSAVIRGSIRNLPWARLFEDPEAGTLTARTRCAQIATGRASTLRRGRIELSPIGYPTESVVRCARVGQFERDLEELLAESHERTPGRWIAVTGGNVSFPRSWFEDAGGFDENLGLRWGAEDFELGYRAERAGLPILAAPEAVVLHMDHEAPGRDRDHEVALRYFAAKHDRPQIMDLLAYFSGARRLREVVLA